MDKNSLFKSGVLFILGMLTIGTGGIILTRSFTSPNHKNAESTLQFSSFPVQAKMDYNWQVQGLDGKELDLAEAQGKVIFLNFWATWCPFCVSEMPSIQGLYDKVKSEKIVFLCVSEEDKTKVSQFVKEKGFTFPIHTLVGKKPPIFNTRGIPATFIISQDGEIVFNYVGAVKWDDKKFIDFIEGLM